MEDNNDFLKIGCSISQKDSECGTLGAFALDERNVVYLFSCNHVLADNGKLIKRNDKSSRDVYSPGNIKPKKSVKNVHVAEIAGFEKLNRFAINGSDFAYAKLLNDIGHTGNIIPEGLEFGGREILFPDHSIQLLEGMEIYKIGAASGLTKGFVSRTNLNYLAVGKYRYEKIVKVQWITNDFPFSIPGDSGSIAFIEMDDSLYFIGIVFAGVDHEDKKLIETLNKHGLMPFTYICNIDKALNNSRLRFLN